MAQRPAVLENLIFELLGVLDVESGFKPSKRGSTSHCFFNFLQDFQAILYHKLYRPLREIVDLLSAGPEERLPANLVYPLQPRLFSSEEFDAFPGRATPDRAGARPLSEVTLQLTFH